MEVTEPTPHTQGTGESPMKNYATDESWPQNLKNPRGSTKREEEGEKISLELGILFGAFFLVAILCFLRANSRALSTCGIACLPRPLGFQTRKGRLNELKDCNSLSEWSVNWNNMLGWCLGCQSWNEEELSNRWVDGLTWLCLVEA